MIQSVIIFLIYVCVAALVVYLVIWVLRDVLGLPLPPKAIQILFVIFALVCLLFLVNLILGGNFGHFGRLGMDGLRMLV